MLAMVLERLGEPLKAVERPDRCRGQARCGSGHRLRGLPHRPPCCRRRTARSTGRRSSPAMRSSAASTPWAPVSRVYGRRPRRDSLARPHLRHCPYCQGGRENLCDRPLFTGYTRDGGFATHAVADAALRVSARRERRGCRRWHRRCARGLIGWRSLGWPARAETSVSTALAPPPISSPRSRVAGPRGLRLHASRAMSPHKTLPAGLALSGPAVRRIAARASRCRDHLCSRGRARTRGAESRTQRRAGGLRRHPHERHRGFPYGILWDERQI